MARHRGSLIGLVEDAMAYSKTTQETLALACGIDIRALKRFLAGSDNLSPYHRGVLKRALGITTDRDLRPSRRAGKKVRQNTNLWGVALPGGRV